MTSTNCGDSMQLNLFSNGPVRPVPSLYTDEGSVNFGVANSTLNPAYTYTTSSTATSGQWTLLPNTTVTSNVVLCHPWTQPTMAVPATESWEAQLVYVPKLFRCALRRKVVAYRMRMHQYTTGRILHGTGAGSSWTTGTSPYTIGGGSYLTTAGTFTAATPLVNGVPIVNGVVHF